ncbi:MAG: gliding motility-associated C-terminal domain-containing protein, partial [Bacteroidales bacterium]|nr:gliding motility-associated C-terminal domain-containing protein [Bacteroidales bacterium]
TANPSGGSGTYAYQWQSSPDGSAWTDIGGATGVSYDPGPITATTHYRVMIDPAGMPDCGIATSSTNTIAITVDPLLPVSVIIAEDQNNICAGKVVSFKASPTNEGSAPVYQWEVNGIPAGSNSDTYVYTPSDSDTVTVILTSDEACATNNPDTSNAIIMLVFSASPGVFDVSGTGTYCSGGTGLPVTLNGSETGVSYQLVKDGTDDGLPVTGDGNPITWNNKTEGIYSVAATNDCGSSDMNGTAVIIMTGDVPAVFNVTGTGIYCFGEPGLPVTLNGSETGVYYQLRKNGLDEGLPVMGDGNPVTWNNNTEGTYTVIATNGCGSAEMNDSAIISEFNTPPTGDANQVFCDNNQTISDLSATGTGIKWYSLPGGGTPLDGSVLLRNDSAYYATQTVDGCESDARLSVIVTINPTPVTSEITGNPAPLCYEEDVTYSVTLSPGSKYLWNVPAAAVITSDTTGLERNSIVVSFGSVSGPITVAETNQYGCAGDIQILDIELQGCNLVADFVADKTAVCQGDTVTFTNQSQGTRLTTLYEWSFGSGAEPLTATGEGPHQVIYTQTGPKTVRLIITEGLTDTLTLADYINVNIIPSASILEESRCGEGIVIFTVEDDPQFDRVEFSKDTTRAEVDKDNTIPYTHSEYLSEDDSVMIWVKVYNSATGCAGNWISSNWGKSYPIPDSTIILNYRKPDAEFQDYVDILCINDSGTYTAEVNPGSIITWNIPSLNIEDETTEILQVYWALEPGDYSVTAFETNIYNCQGPVSETFVHISVPEVSIGEDEEICEGESYTFTTNETFEYYEWHDGSNLPTFTSGEEGMVKVTVSDEYGCSASDSAMLIVHPLPVPDLGKDTVLCGTGAYRLEVPGFYEYQWSTGETGSYIFIYAGQQTISLTVTDRYGCTGTDAIQIIECSPVNLLGKVTNAFTPNEDGNHDEWVINNIELFPDAKIEVFDRWGRRVFSVDGGYKNDWKGTFNGKDLPVDNYYYVIDLKVPGSEPITGTLTIIR